MSEHFNRFVDHPEGFWKVSEQEMRCAITYHGTLWLRHAIEADAFFYVHDAWKNEEPPKVEYRPFFADNLEVTYTPAKQPGFIGPMQTVVLKEGSEYKMNGKTIIESSRSNGWYEQQFIEGFKDLVKPNINPKPSVGEAILNWLDSFVTRMPDRDQPDVPAKNKPKGPQRTRNQRGAWWNK